LGILELFRLDGKVSVVTGSSRGLGQAMAVALAEAGAYVLGISSSPSAPETERMVRGCGSLYRHLSLDLSSLDEEGARRAMEEAESMGELCVLVNNAGTIRRKPFLEHSVEDFDEVLSLNLRSTFVLSRAFAALLVEKGRRGKIVNVASLLSFQGGIHVVSYAASKHGVLGLTRAMANELAPYGICVNAIAPGYMETELTEGIRLDGARFESITSRIPMGRWGRPEDVKGALLFLASPASDYVTGAVLPVDGGWLSR